MSVGLRVNFLPLVGVGGGPIPDGPEPVGIILGMSRNLRGGFNDTVPLFQAFIGVHQLIPSVAVVPVLTEHTTNDRQRLLEPAPVNEDVGAPRPPLMVRRTI